MNLNIFSTVATVFAATNAVVSEAAVVTVKSVRATGNLADVALITTVQYREESISDTVNDLVTAGAYPDTDEGRADARKAVIDQMSVTL